MSELSKAMTEVVYTYVKDKIADLCYLAITLIVQGLISIVKTKSCLGVK